MDMPKLRYNNQAQENFGNVLLLVSGSKIIHSFYTISHCDELCLSAISSAHPVLFIRI
jgi:hypothetical protein